LEFAPVQEFDVESADAPSAWVGTLGTFALAVVPPAALIYLSPSAFQFFVIGAVSWVTALVAKLLCFRLPGVKAAVARDGWGAAAWGLFSAAIELSSALIPAYLYSESLTLSEIAAFGFGASSVEIVYVVGSGIAEHIKRPNLEVLQAWIIGARASLWVRNMLFLERLSATAGHVSGRGLAYISLSESRPWAGIAALICFAAVDGVAIYGKSKRWNWFDPDIARKFYLFCLVVASIEVILFAASTVMRGRIAISALP
jgi:hypothetical protein